MSSGENKKKFQNVTCWHFYPVCCSINCCLPNRQKFWNFRGLIGSIIFSSFMSDLHPHLKAEEEICYFRDIGSPESGEFVITEIKKGKSQSGEIWPGFWRIDWFYWLTLNTDVWLVLKHIPLPCWKTRYCLFLDVLKCTQVDLPPFPCPPKA